MPDYAMRSDFDALIQTLQSNPGEKGRPFFRGVPSIIDRSYLSVAGPAQDSWDTFYSYQGRGGVLFPDRQAEFRLIFGASNNSGRTLWYLLRIRLNDDIFYETAAAVNDGVSITRTAVWRIIATGGNNGQLIEMQFGASSPVVSSHEENLANPWTVTVEVTWREEDPDAVPFVSYEDFLTLPADDTFFFRYHALAVLT